VFDRTNAAIEWLKISAKLLQGNQELTYAICNNRVALAVVFRRRVI
jgi:hypothetical protein